MSKIPLVPDNIYKRFRETFLKESMWTHYFLHCSVCLLKDNLFNNYKVYTPKDWIESWGSI